MLDSELVYSFLKFDLHIKDERTLRNMLRRSKLFCVKKGETINHPGFVSDSVIFLISGYARCYTIDEEGRDITFQFSYHTGDLLFSGIPIHKGDNYYWEALSIVKYLVVPKLMIKSAFESDLQFRSYLFSYLQNSFYNETALRSALVTMRAKDRYLWFLEQYNDFPSKIPQKYIATYLHMLPQTLSEIRGELKRSVSNNL